MFAQLCRGLIAENFFLREKMLASIQCNVLSKRATNRLTFMNGMLTMSSIQMAFFVDYFALCIQYLLIFCFDI
ncbi:hypothetical protein T12_12763 [Trichinella patagoniensis]|uniref:Uncharacterized protein n=1 Tax=Trichinella patagoniensis TaxID=990121 RepID=A0A0V1A6D7_9BILA|nr:hypothetical protein T12_12763 [Trichinella patagoniensis]